MVGVGDFSVAVRSHEDSSVRLSSVLTRLTSLVCTHGSRDSRCGRIGPKLIRALRDEIKSRHVGDGVIDVLATSHVGGHKFAGTMIVYPEADWYGYVTARNAKMIVDHLLRNERIETKWRGNEICNVSSGLEAGCEDCELKKDVRE